MLNCPIRTDTINWRPEGPMSVQLEAKPLADVRVYPRPEGAKAVVSVGKYIFFIIFNIVEFKELYVFGLKSLFCVMLLLVLHISNCFVNYGLTYREYAISSLPCKILVFRRERFYPSATVTFHFFD